MFRAHPAAGHCRARLRYNAFRARVLTARASRCRRTSSTGTGASGQCPHGAPPPYYHHPLHHHHRLLPSRFLLAVCSAASRPILLTLAPTRRLLPALPFYLHPIRTLISRLVTSPLLLLPVLSAGALLPACSARLLPSAADRALRCGLLCLCTALVAARLTKSKTWSMLCCGTRYGTQARSRARLLCSTSCGASFPLRTACLPSVWRARVSSSSATAFRRCTSASTTAISSRATSRIQRDMAIIVLSATSSGSTSLDHHAARYKRTRRFEC